MLVFATSNKGGTGRSVTSANLVYRQALRGRDVCYADFDFASPTAGSIFDIDDALNGTANRDGLHSYLGGNISTPRAIEVWRDSGRASLGSRPALAGRMVLLPGDLGGAEFASSTEIINGCARLFARLEEEFDVTLVDLSAGRSYATEIALAATAPTRFTGRSRWLVFHRWSRQHLLAAADLIYGTRGLLQVGASHGHDPSQLREGLRTVRTAIVDPERELLSDLADSQRAWLRAADGALRQLAAEHRLGRTMMLGSVPLDPVLQWREQLITDDDVYSRAIANEGTVQAFEVLAARLVDDAAWEML
jgi:hypothetical protein